MTDTKKQFNASICWECANCSPLRCEWVDKHKKVWSKAKHHIDCDGTELDIVLKCDHYKEDKHGY